MKDIIARSRKSVIVPATAKYVPRLVICIFQIRFLLIPEMPRLHHVSDSKFIASSNISMYKANVPTTK